MVESLALILPPLPAKFSKEYLLPIPTEFGYVPPLNLVSLASFVKRNDPSARPLILDGNVLSRDQIFHELKKYRPSVVGISPDFINYGSALEIARFAKGSGSRVIFGGHYAAALAENIVRNRGPYSDDHCVDAVVREDGEEALWQIISQKPFARIPNLVYQGEIGAVSNKIRQLDLDRLPMPDFSLAMAEGRFSAVKFLPVFSRKGCRWRAEKGACLFCILMDKGCRRKSPRFFYEEIKALIRMHQPEVIFDVGDNFLDDAGWLEEFRRLYAAQPFRPQWQCYARVDDFTPAAAERLKAIGASRIIFGVESNDDEILASFGKGYASGKNRNAVELVGASGISARINFVIGGINESRESLERTLAFAVWSRKILKERAFFFVSALYPYPGSRAFSLLVQKTGAKYLNRDILDYRQLLEDWFGNFCRVSFREASEFIAGINDLNKTGAAVPFRRRAQEIN